MIFRQFRFFRKFESPYTNYFRRQTSLIYGKENPWRSGLEMDMYNTCAKFRDLSLKNGIDISTLVRKSV